jgi:hypothetical protein
MPKVWDQENLMTEFDRFREYQHLVTDTGRITDRRQTNSNIFVAVNSLLLAAIGILIKDIGGASPWTLLLPLPLIAAGFVDALWWRQLIRQYRALIALRIETLRRIEEMPEMAQSVKIYHSEDQLYPRNADGGLIPGRGLNFSDMEVRLPSLFLVLYGVLGAGVVVMLVTRVW